MISYVGGKYKMAKWISDFIEPCKNYVEVFGGAY
jgi:site-specific DNA-adenine methylase